MFRLLNKFHFTCNLSSILALCLIIQVGAAPATDAQANSNNNASSYNNSTGTNSKSNSGALGLVVNWNYEGRLLITQVVPGGPADRAGVSVGDRLFSIDGQNIDGLPAAQVFSSILGAVGSKVVLDLSSPGKGNYQAKLTRVSIESLKNSGNFKIGWQPANNMPAAGGPKWNRYGGADSAYSLSYPDGWTVQQSSKSGRIEVKSPGKSNLSIFPFFLPDQSFNINKADGLFQAMLKQYAPDKNWSAPTVAGGGLKAISRSNGINSIAGMALSGVNNGSSGSLVIMQIEDSPNAASDLSALAQILQSFKITGADSDSPEKTASVENSSGDHKKDNIQYIQFVDPNFAAFSLDVPAGWNVSGGMKKPVPIDLRPWVKAVSPDEKIAVFIGDGSIEPRYLPAAWLSAIGCPPGSTYKHSTGLVSKVLYYEPAEKFVKKYAESRFGKACDSFEIVNTEQHLDLARTINGTQGVLASDAASIKCKFSAHGYDGEAYFLAATKKGKTMWWVSQICGVVAAGGYEQEALDVFLRMYKSWQYNPQWSQAQNAQNIQSTQNWIATDRAARARSAAAFQSRMAALDASHNAFRSRMADMDASHARYMNSMRSSDRAQSNFINYIRDEDTLMNPETGTKYQVEYGPKYHWVNSTGDTTLSTDSAWSPGVNWTELVTPPR